MTFAKSAYNPDDFAATRHIGPKQSDIDQMLAAIGADSLDQLIKETVPDALRQKTDLSWPALSENDLLAHMRGVAAKNQVNDQPDRPGLLRHVYPTSDRAQ